MSAKPKPTPKNITPIRTLIGTRTNDGMNFSVAETRRPVIAHVCTSFFTLIPHLIWLPVTAKVTCDLYDTPVPGATRIRVHGNGEIALDPDQGRKWAEVEYDVLDVLGIERTTEDMDTEDEFVHGSRYLVIREPGYNAAPLDQPHRRYAMTYRNNHYYYFLGDQGDAMCDEFTDVLNLDLPLDNVPDILHFDLLISNTQFKGATCLTIEPDGRVDHMNGYNFLRNVEDCVILDIPAHRTENIRRWILATAPLADVNREKGVLVAQSLQAPPVVAAKKVAKQTAKKVAKKAAKVRRAR